MGGLLDAAVERFGPELTVSDPFSGGGTVTFEAAKRGLRAYAQDLYPWPARGLAAALTPCDTTELRRSAAAVLNALEGLRNAYRNPLTGAELTHILRVRTCTCKSCEATTFDFPAVLVSLASRGVGEKNAFFGCRACGELTLHEKAVGKFKCDGCGQRWSTTDKVPTTCASCKGTSLKASGWQAVLVQELHFVGNQQARARLRKVEPGDPVDLDRAVSPPAPLQAVIAAGLETNRLVTSGFETWAQLYSGRQVEAICCALEAVRNLDAPQGIRDRLAFAVLGACEMPGLLSRWDRFHLKPFEGLANHRYSPTGFVAEANLLSPVGRGTLAKRLEKVALGHDWLFQNGQLAPKVVTSATSKRGRRHSQWDVLVTTGSSSKQLLPDESVNVVITDPPYFDDVQYGELARLFHAWLRIYDPSIQVDESKEASPNSERGTSAQDYENTIAACLRESRRTLKRDGVLVLTFHNKRMAAWRALAGAIAAAGFQVRALAVVKAENDADHCKRNVQAMLHDLVIECSPVRRRSHPTQLELKPRSAEEKNLAAIGLALAECVEARDSAGIVDAYQHQLQLLGAVRQIA